MRTRFTIFAARRTQGRGAPMRCSIPVGAIMTLAVAGCSPSLKPERPSQPVQPSTAVASPSAGPLSTPSSAPQPTVRTTPRPTAAPVEYTDAEAFLLDGIRKDARINCAPRREDLPPKAIAGVECAPDTRLVSRVGFYRFSNADDMLAAYFGRLAESGVKPDSFRDDAWEGTYLPCGPPDCQARNAGFINAQGYANFRATLPIEWVVEVGETAGLELAWLYVGILGNGRDPQALDQWAFLGAEGDTPAIPTIWQLPGG